MQLLQQIEIHITRSADVAQRRRRLLMSYLRLHLLLVALSILSSVRSPHGGDTAREPRSTGSAESLQYEMLLFALSAGRHRDPAMKYDFNEENRPDAAQEEGGCRFMRKTTQNRGDGEGRRGEGGGSHLAVAGATKTFGFRRWYETSLRWSKSHFL